MKEVTRAPEITQPLVELEVLEGTVTTMECHVAGAPTAHVTWYRDNVPLVEDERVSSSFDGTICTLTIYDTKLDDEGDYKCVVKSDQGEVSTRAELSVEEGLSLPLFRQELESLLVKEGHTACFDVRVVGKPDPVVEWFKDNVQLQDEGRIMIIDDVDDNDPDLFSLVIEHCKPCDTGNYKCVVMNEAGSSSCTATLSVTPLSEATKSPDANEIPLNVSEDSGVYKCDAADDSSKTSVATEGKI